MNPKKRVKTKKPPRPVESLDEIDGATEDIPISLQDDFDVEEYFLEHTGHRRVDEEQRETFRDWIAD